MLTETVLALVFLSQLAAVSTLSALACSPILAANSKERSKPMLAAPTSN